VVCHVADDLIQLCMIISVCAHEFKTNDVISQGWNIV
jgi:hypothetical protein